MLKGNMQTLPFKVVRDGFSKISFLSDLPKFSPFTILNTPSL